MKSYIVKGGMSSIRVLCSVGSMVMVMGMGMVMVMLVVYSSCRGQGKGREG